MNKNATPVVNINELSRISTSTTIKGEVNSQSDIRIDGNIEGKITSCGRVVVGENAVIKGDIVCENVDFWGTIEGNLYVKDTLTLKDTSKVKGNLNTRRLVVELGASFDGNCKMLSEADFEKAAGSVSEESAE